MPRVRLVAAADRSAASAGPPVEREAHAGILLFQRTKTESLWFASNAARADRSSDWAVSCFASVVDADVEVGVLVVPAWFDPLEQPASTTAARTIVRATVIGVAQIRRGRDRR